MVGEFCPVLGQGTIVSPNKILLMWLRISIFGGILYYNSTRNSVGA